MDDVNLINKLLDFVSDLSGICHHSNVSHITVSVNSIKIYVLLHNVKINMHHKSYWANKTDVPLVHCWMEMYKWTNCLTSLLLVH